MTDYFATPDDLGEIRQSDLQSSLGERLSAQALDTLDPKDSLSGAYVFRRIREGMAGGQFDDGGLDTNTGFNTQDALEQAEQVRQADLAAIPDTSIDDAKARIKQEGLEGQITLPDQPSIKSPVLDLMINEAHERRDREIAIAKGPQGFVPGALGLVTSLGAGMIDPVNMAAFSIPVLGEARAGKLLASAGDSILARSGTRMLEGGAQGAVGTAVLQPADWWLHTKDGQDYTLADALKSVVMGAGMGGAFHAAGGAFGDFRARSKGAPLPGSPQEQLQRALLTGAQPGESPIAPPPEPPPGNGFPGDFDHPANVLADLPPAAREDVVKAAIADMAADRPVRAAEMLKIAADHSPRIAEAFEAPQRLSDEALEAEISKWTSGVSGGADLSSLPEAVDRFGEPLAEDTTFYRGEWPGRPDFGRESGTISVSDRKAGEAFALSRNETELEKQPHDGLGPPRLPLSEIRVPKGTKVLNAAPHAGANAGELERMLPPGTYRKVGERTEPWDFSGTPAEHHIRSYEFTPDVPPSGNTKITLGADPDLVTAPKPRGRAAANPDTLSLSEHLASKGGIRPDPELEAIYGNARGPFVPGFGPLIRKGGMSLDDALSSAKQHGYMFDAHDAENGTAGGTQGSSGRTSHGLTPNNLLDHLDAENRGQKLYKAGHVEATRFDPEQEKHVVLGHVEQAFSDAGLEVSAIDPKLLDRTVEIVHREGVTDVLDAYERAIMGDEERYNAIADARRANPATADVPGFDDAIHDTRAAPGDGGRDSLDDRQAGRPEPGRGGPNDQESPGHGAGPLRPGADAASDPRWRELADVRPAEDDPDIIAESKAADRLEEPASLVPERSLTELERQAAEAEAVWRKMEPGLSEDERRIVNDVLDQLKLDKEARDQIITDGAACLTAAFA